MTTPTHKDTGAAHKLSSAEVRNRLRDGNKQLAEQDDFHPNTVMARMLDHMVGSTKVSVKTPR